jgi:methyl-accepting chemotaxis protein
MKVLLHAMYVVVQTAFGVYMATRMRQAANTGDELGRMVYHVSAEGGTVALDVGDLPVSSPLAGQFKATLLRLNGALYAVRDSIASIQTASSEVASGSADLSQRTEQTASSLQQAASAMAQLTGSVRQSAESAAQANQLAGAAVQAAQRGGAVVAQVVTNMDDISAASKRIADIIGTIDGIAFQTNILALNAAVEAARAGEQGRGFAVVASEVRSLAKRSADAAREIKGLIGESTERVVSGSRLVQEAGQNMGEIVAGIQRVGAIIAEITAAAGEQHRGISAVNQSVSQLDGMTQQNAALVEQSTAAAESLQAQAAQMAEVINRFRLAAESADHSRLA